MSTGPWLGQWPEKLAAACTCALSASRLDRFPDAQEVKKEVGDWLESVAAGGENTKIWKQLAGLLGRH